MNKLTLFHYSNEPTITARTIAQRASYPSGLNKPQGLWVSVVVDGQCDWQRWCESDWPGWMHGKLRHEVVLRDDANILHVQNALALDAFTQQFCVGDSIDWPGVAELYDGIIIAPYCWERRLTRHTFWYYGWDAASGCIWNGDAIDKVGENSPPQRSATCASKPQT